VCFTIYKKFFRKSKCCNLFSPHVHGQRVCVCVCLCFCLFPTSRAERERVRENKSETFPCECVCVFVSKVLLLKLNNFFIIARAALTDGGIENVYFFAVRKCRVSAIKAAKRKKRQKRVNEVFVSSAGRRGSSSVCATQRQSYLILNTHFRGKRTLTNIYIVVLLHGEARERELHEASHSQHWCDGNCYVARCSLSHTLPPPLR
jgi:hypothetical protein